MSDGGKEAAAVQNETAQSLFKKAAIAGKLEELLDNSVELYRHYDSWGKLLYVGVSLSALERLADHRATCAWFKQIKMISIERYPTRALALDAEREAIKKEKPFFNRKHRRDWKSVRYIPGGEIAFGRELGLLLKKIAGKHAPKSPPAPTTTH